MKILFWMFIGFDQHATSEHLLIADIEQLCKAGHSVHVIQKNTGGTRPAVPEKLSGYSVTTTIIPYKAANKHNFMARYLQDLKYIEASKKYISSDYDAVFIQSTTVAGLAVRVVRNKLPEAKVTLNVQDIFPYNAVFSGNIKKNSIIFKTLAVIQRYGYKYSDHIITISEDMKDLLIFDGVKAEKIEVVYNWSYQDELYDEIDITPVSYMMNKDFFNVVYAGNIGVMQNVDILIEAAKLMNEDENVWFHIIGNGVHKVKLESRVKEYNINNISFWPLQPPDLAPVIYSAADVNVIPLEKDVYRTALPSKTATCLACQKPIIFAIGKDSKFGQKVMKEAGCEVIDADKPEELVDTIRNIQNQNKCNNKMGEFFLKYCSITKNSKKYAEIITRQ